MQKLFGVYADKNNPVCKLHPLVKFSFSFVFVLVAGFLYSPTPLFLLTAIFLAVVRTVGIPFQALLRIVRPFAFLIAFTFIIQLFLTPNGNWIAPNLVSFINAIIFTYRIAVMIGFSAIFAVITPQADIVRVFRFFFTPLKLFRLNPNEIAMSMLIALRFIPMLFIEGEKILDSQRLKGVLPLKDEKGARLKTLKAIPSLIVPLFVRAFHYASQIAVTLQYRGNNEDFFKLPNFRTKDILAMAVIILMGVGVFFAGNVS